MRSPPDVLRLLRTLPVRDEELSCILVDREKTVVDEMRMVRTMFLESLEGFFGYRADDVSLSLLPVNIFGHTRVPRESSWKDLAKDFQQPFWSWGVGVHGHDVLCGYTWYALNETGMVLRVGADRALFRVTNARYDEGNEVDVDWIVEGSITGFSKKNPAWTRLQLCVCIILATHPQAYKILKRILTYNKNLCMEAEPATKRIADDFRRVLGITTTPEEHIRKLVADLARRAGDTKLQRALRALTFPLGRDGFTLLCRSAHLPRETIQKLTAEFCAEREPRFHPVPLGRCMLETDVTPDMLHATWTIHEDVQSPRQLEVFEVCSQAFGREDGAVSDAVDFRQLRVFLRVLRARCRVLDALTSLQRLGIAAAAARVARAVSHP